MSNLCGRFLTLIVKQVFNRLNNKVPVSVITYIIKINTFQQDVHASLLVGTDK